MSKAKNLDELNRLYLKAEEVDRDIFAEMRSNILLVSGDHYQKPGRHERGPRGANLARPSEKLRLIKNHMHRISRNYVSSILSESPSVIIRPQIETDLQDQKDAELNHGVWLDISRRHKIKRKTADWCKTFVDIGEICVKIFWDPMAGEFKGYQDAVDPETKETLMEDTGELESSIDPVSGQWVQTPVQRAVKDEAAPIFSGDLVFENVYAFNLLREAGAQEMYEHGRAWIVRKMMDNAELASRYKDQADKFERITASRDDTYIVFDANSGSYEKVQNQTLVREFYWPACSEYPEGYFVYATKDVVLEEGKLPGGLWPFVWEGFDKYPTTPRGRSIHKVARPYQAEINRSGSAIATHQVTLGDDKVLYQAGTKLQQGALLPGVRGIAFQGAQPSILPGRDGSQFQPYVISQIQEMDQAVMLQENMLVDPQGQVDPYAMLYQAASKKRVYSNYIEKFEDVLVGVAELALGLSKIYLPDDALIAAVGVREQINIEEFRKTTKLSHQIAIEPGQDTLETMFGKQLSIQHLLQYVGKNLEKRDIGKFIKNMPFGGLGDDFDDFTMDETIAKNTMLALERGVPRQATPYVDPDYMLRKLTNRMETPEYEFLRPEVKAAYEQLKTGYEQIRVANEQKLLAAKNEFIPIDGALVTVDMYVQDPGGDPNKESKRARLPQRSVEWLMSRLQEQGMDQQKLEGMNATAMGEMAQMLLQGQGGQGQGQGQLAAPQQFAQ